MPDAQGENTRTAGVASLTSATNTTPASEAISNPLGAIKPVSLPAIMWSKLSLYIIPSRMVLRRLITSKPPVEVSTSSKVMTPSPLAVKAALSMLIPASKVLSSLESTALYCATCPVVAPSLAGLLDTERPIIGMVVMPSSDASFISFS